MGQSIPPSPTPSAKSVSHIRETMAYPANTSHPRDYSAYLQLSHDLPLEGCVSTIKPSGTPNGPLPGEIGCSSRAPCTFDTSPPTPNPSDAITTRSGLSIAKNAALSKSLGVKGSRVNRKRRTPKPRDGSTILAKPLSEIAKNVPNVPVADIAAFVTRSTEERLSETSRNKKAGWIKRPMNAFMLYRKAYQDVAKTQCAQNNHQHVSKVCGASWPMESNHIHDLFNDWAQIERENHQKAHPDYKFTPSKSRKGRREGDVDAASTVFSDAEDSDWASTHGRRRADRAISHLSETPSMPYNQLGSMDPVEASQMDPSLHYHNIFAYSTPRQPFPLHYGQLDVDPYDQVIPQRVNTLGFVPEVMSRSPSPAFHYGLQSMDGSPGYTGSYYQEHGSPLEHFVHSSMQAGPQYELIDGLPREPSLGPQDVWHPQLDSGHDWVSMGPSYENERAHDAYLRGKQEDWHVEELDEASQFEHWIKQTEEGLI